MRTQRISITAILSCVLLAGANGALAQIFPAKDLTDAFNGYLQKVANNGGMAFVSACTSPTGGRAGGDTEILMIPLGSKSGDLTTLTGHEVYNGTGIRFESGRPTLVDPGGGIWSQHRLQSMADDLVKAGFQLMSGDALRKLITLNPTRRCPPPPDNWIPPEFLAHPPRKE